MKLNTSSATLARVDTIIEGALRAARIPGAAIAVVAGGKMVYAKGYGYGDLRAKKPVVPETVYPIASTSKAMNATLLGMLVEEGRLDWDAPVQNYLPQFRLRDPIASARVTVRDLVTMRTGLPRHDAVWEGNATTRADIVGRMAHLDASADFRRRLQYCNLSVTAAGHVAEAITGQTWEELVRQRIFVPLKMRHTQCGRPKQGNVTLAYHENARRKILPTQLRASEVTAPSGGSIHSTVVDMTRWMLFNLERGAVGRRQLIRESTLEQLHAPQVVVGDRPLAGLSPEGAYALGWLVDSYNGHKRISHGGYLDDVNSSLMLFPSLGIGLVCFVNFGCAVLAPLINQHVFDAMMGQTPVRTFEEALAQYETKIENARRRIESVERVANTRPSQPLSTYAGEYQNAGYGRMTINRRGDRLTLLWNDVRLKLKHWHYDVWIAEDDDRWAIHQPHAFDGACAIQFHSDARGRIAMMTIPLEPEVAPILFSKQQKSGK